MGPLMVSVSGVRGIVGLEFHPLLVARWASAFEAGLPQGAIVVGRDSRPSGERLACAAMDILQSCGREVWDLGIVPTPTVQVAVESWAAAGGLILTASHNPSEWNALKFVGPDGSFLSAAAFHELHERVEAEPKRFRPAERWGSRDHRGGEALTLHRDRIMGKIDVAAVRERSPSVLIDCVHGAGGVLLPDLLCQLGARVEVLNGEPHGRFPREPEPTGKALDELAAEAARRGVDFAVAVDPDADRCGLACPNGPVVGEEWTLPLVAAHLLRSRRGPVVTNLSTSTRLDAVAEGYGCPLERTPVGEAHVVARMREIRAVLGGEGNGGVIDPEIHYGRDAAVAAAWLLEAHVKEDGGLAGIASRLPPRYLLKAKLPLPGGGDETGFLERLRERFGEATDDRDGLRWAMPGGFVHVRASATEPILRVVVEAISEDGVQSLMKSVVELAQREDRG